MQTTFTGSLLNMSQEILSILDRTNFLFNTTKRNLYADIIKFYKLNNTNKLSKSKINNLKSSYQTIYNINSRHYNSIHDDLFGNINSILALNKNYLQDIKDKIIYLEKVIKSKQSMLESLIKKTCKSDCKENKLNSKIISELYHLNQKLKRANNNLIKLQNVENTGNPHLCFGSKKLFKQQFQINGNNNLNKFKSHANWLKAWTQSRNKNFMMIGSKDETAGNTNCQITHIEKDIYELQINIPKALGLKDKYITVQIKTYNDKQNYLFNTIINNQNKDKQFHQAISYRFYRDYKKNTYKIFISLDKNKQQSKVVSYKLLGSIGIDINHDHLSVSEINHHGNLIKAFDLSLSLKGKNSNQANDNIACVVKTITDYAVTVGKPIVIEKLDFSSKKKTLQDSYNKKYNVMLSSFAYRKILELIKSRSFDKGIETIEVNPVYTSKIGQFKYQSLYRLTRHRAASFVIARRGILSYEKNIKIKYKDKLTGNVNEIVKPIVVINKENTIKSFNNKYYSFELPVRNIQRKNNVYWKLIDQNYRKAKKKKFELKKQIKIHKSNLLKQDLGREISLVVDNFEVNRDLNPELLFQPF